MQYNNNQQQQQNLDLSYEDLEKSEQMLFNSLVSVNGYNEDSLETWKQINQDTPDISLEDL
jgi:hypothetical protein